MKALITGITGFAGSHLAEYLLERDDLEVHGTVRWRSRTENIEHIESRVRLHECDLRDAAAVYKVVDEVRPDLVFHLAAQSFVPTSWLAPSETLTTNVIGQVNLFEAFRRSGINPRIQVACSSEEYGLVHPDEVPIRETNPLRPLSPYGVSKVAQDYLAYQYFKSYGLHAVRTRTFNHTGPRRGRVFVTSDFARQVALIELGLKEPILEVGNLAALRDFTDVRDVVHGYWLALEKGEPGEVYNLASGKAYSIQEVVDLLLDLSKKPIFLRQDPSRMRPSDVPILLGDAGKFWRQTGWEPRIPFEQTVEDLLNYWRAYLRKNETPSKPENDDGMAKVPAPEGDG